MKRTSLKKKKNKNEISQESYDLVGARCKGVCEICKQTRWEATHHIEKRRTRNHTPENLIAVCFDCHVKVHAQPSWSYANGYMKRIGAYDMQEKLKDK